MATYVDQAYYGWAHDDVNHQDESQEVSASQMLDHGSISFGRFAYESLSWERRSVFTHNKCQEELEKFKCPGLVAKKKAYFEEHYRKIRAMKEAQENQPTELTLEYGGDDSISSQNGEEDETAAHLVKHGKEEIVAVNSHPEESVEISIREEINSTINSGSSGSIRKDLEQEHQAEYPVIPNDKSAENSVEKVQGINETTLSRTILPETRTLNLDSLSSNSDDLRQEDNDTYRHQLQQFDIETHDIKSATTIIEVTEHIDLNNLDKEDISREKYIAHAEPERDPNTTDLYSSKLKPVKTMVSESVLPHVRNDNDRALLHKAKEQSAIGREDKTKLHIVKPSPRPIYSPQMTPTRSEIIAGSSKASAYKFSRNHNSPGTPSRRSLSEVHSSTTILRPFSAGGGRRASAMSGIGDIPLKPNPMVSNKLKPLAVHKTEAVTIPRPSSAATDRRAGILSGVRESLVKSNQIASNKVTSLVGHKKEAVTIPRPSSASSNRRAGILAGTRASLVKSDQIASNKVTPSAVHKKEAVIIPRPSSAASDRRSGVVSGIKATLVKSDLRTSHNRTPFAVYKKEVNVQDNSKKTIMTAGVQLQGLENKRVHEERKKHSPLEKQPVAIKDKGGNIPNMRSVNIPARNTCSSSNVTDNKIRNERRSFGQEAKHESRSREVSDTGRKVSAAAAGNLRREPAKIVTSMNGRNPRFGEQSLDGNKPRQERPRWR